MPRRRTAPLTALVLSLTVALGACGSDGTGPTDPAASSTSPSPSPSASATQTPSETGSPSESPTESGTRIEIERAGDEFSPSGERVKVAVGEPITLVITADEAGELDVHSRPSQLVSYGPGTSEQRLTIDQPGLVEVESHDPALVLLQLEVR